MSKGLKSVTFIYYRAVNGLRFNYTGQDGYENSSELFGNNGQGPDAKRVSLVHYFFLMHLVNNIAVSSPSCRCSLSCQNYIITYVFFLSIWQQTVHLGPKEFVTELSGTYQHEVRSNNIAIYSLKLVTNLGKTHGPFGTASIGTGFSFSVPPNSRIVGFFGGSTGYAVNSIGAYTLENSA
jgi:hypothetical protein